MRRGEKASSVGKVDVLLALNAVLAAVILFALPNINPPANPTDSIKPPGQIAVTICWPKGSDDIDAWAGAPGEEPVGYLHKTGKIWSLLLDNRGQTGGRSPANCEALFARDTPAGEYTINVFGFAVGGPVPVHIEAGIGNGGGEMHTLVNTDMMVNPRQERTVIRFFVDSNGEVVPGSVNQLFNPLFIGGGRR